MIMEKVITIVPMMESGKGCSLRIVCDEIVYNSEVTDELTSVSLQKLFDDMKSAISSDQIDDITLKFNEFLDSVKKMEDEEKYRKEHPEEFMHDARPEEVIA